MDEPAHRVVAALVALVQVVQPQLVKEMLVVVASMAARQAVEQAVVVVVLDHRVLTE
jgi:hypothetical protein